MNLQWKSEKKTFLHVCPVCGDDHYGRKNKVYCSPGCKARLNNDLASERRERHLAASAGLIRNVDILAEAMSFHLGGIAIVPMQSLLNKGFDPYAPMARVGIEGEVWLRNGDFAFQVFEEQKQIKITKIN